MYKNLKVHERSKVSSSVIGGLFICLIAISIICSINFINFKLNSIVNSWEDKVYKGVTVNNLDISGLTEVSLRQFLESNFSNDLDVFDVKFKIDNENIVLSSKDLGLVYDYEKVISEAFGFSKNLDYFSKISQIFNPTKKLNIMIDNKFDIKNVDYVYEKLSENFGVEPVDGKISILDGQVYITDSASGIEIDKQSLIKMINDTDPKIASENGIEISSRTVEPRISSVDLSRINGQLSSYTTSYKSSSAARAGNIELSAESINGTVLMPGESFSFNKVVGPRTKERGYGDAAIIVDNVYESGLGGGICQTSSTLHQAVIRAGIIPTQRRNHTLPTSYMPLGFDAAVAWGSLDYVFKNTYDFPILIDISTQGRNLTVSIYGDVTAVDKSYSVVSETYESVPYTTKTINDNTIQSGKQVVEKSGSNGTRVRVYLLIKNKYTDEVIEKKFLWNDYYVPQERVVRVGTK